LLTVLTVLPASAVTFRQLRLEVRDSGGAHLDARASVRSDSSAPGTPTRPTPTLLAHAGYSYPPWGAAINVPEGWVTLYVSRGPEWIPDTRKVWIARDTTVNVKLTRFLDMRSRNFYSSDLHVHSRHDPIEFDVPPSSAKRIAKAETLAILHLLDNEFRFSGAPTRSATRRRSFTTRGSTGT
jgi:hypothetical protein